MSQPAYIIANVNVNDSEQYDKYRALSSQAIREHDAEIVVRGGAQTVLEGAFYPRTVIIKFASIEKAQAFYDSETYRTARELRKDVAMMNLMIVEGVL